MVLGLILVAGVSGCRGDGLVHVTGRLTYKGDPVPSTEVLFFPDDGGRRSVGRTDNDGRFTLRFSNREEGVSLGKHTVCLNYYVSAEEETGKVPTKVSREVKAVLSGYRTPDKSDIHVEITRSGQFVELKLE
jgi:hypothetical protein